MHDNPHRSFWLNSVAVVVQMRECSWCCELGLHSKQRFCFQLLYYRNSKSWCAYRNGESGLVLIKTKICLCKLNSVPPDLSATQFLDAGVI